MKNNSNDLQQALNYAKRLLKFRARSKKELEERLMQKGFLQQIVQSTVEELEKSGLINDEKFAYLFAYDMLTVQGYGPYRIKAKLKQLGVPEEFIDDALDKVLREVDLESLVKRIVQLHKVDRGELREFLYRRGFSSEYTQALDIEGGADE
ncbi:MAG TPA: regulatory protein RecX [Pseudothermotoga sp.]|nr:regulatory protein RecX [Pseudothermotoga sp.]HOK84368.1 regulatory protein RecX [Pseudothermotoga sp.]HPP70780.1 regulatory protein RecX [Pseudothermotoga sp.]